MALRTPLRLARGLARIVRPSLAAAPRPRHRQLHTAPRRLAAATEPTPLDAETYHEHSERYFEALLDGLEEMQEARGEIDVEYAAGVLTTVTPKGTYVLNKQPPNRQIWLSSPVSGPKRFDWVGGEWVYLRDGTRLSALLKREVGVDVAGG